MIAFAIPLFIVILIVIFSAGGNIFKGAENSLSRIRPYFFVAKDLDQKDQGQSPTTSVLQKPTVASPSFTLDTAITAGPKEKESIINTQITFEFSGSQIPSSTQEQILFESKVPGVDTDWITTQNTRTLNLPTGSKEYTLLVRSKLNTVVDETPASRIFSVNVSPYFQKVIISSLSTAVPSLIALKANLKQGEEISITGWKIQGKAGSFEVPLGIEQINPFSSLQPGDPIKVKTTDAVYLSSSRGPFGLGKHFKPNICMGYLKSSYSFPLSVPSSCDFDKPKEETILFLLQACQDFLLKKVSYGSCTIPDYSQDISIKADTECTAYIENNLGYTPCFNKHQKEPGFLKDEWHIYMNMNLLTQRFDTIELLDQNGLVVDQEKYSL